ncbi:unnamed protein product [Anisakis simplex]|uniref:Uncharacterized protein n=1 Tax=Anisakis simplex TaxID=6269 RepID=A0A0M3JYA8_ANISI|nr:unnamed protein product [Anisakis simplex]
MYRYYHLIWWLGDVDSGLRATVHLRMLSIGERLLLVGVVEANASTRAIDHRPRYRVSARRERPRTTTSSSVFNQQNWNAVRILQLTEVTACAKSRNRGRNRVVGEWNSSSVVSTAIQGTNIVEGILDGKTQPVNDWNAEGKVCCGVGHPPSNTIVGPHQEEDNEDTARFILFL